MDDLSYTELIHDYISGSNLSYIEIAEDLGISIEKLCEVCDYKIETYKPDIKLKIFDSTGNNIFLLLGFNYWVKMFYDENNVLIKKTFAGGQYTYLEYNSNGGIMLEINSDGSQIHYDDNGVPYKFTDQYTQN